MMKILLVIVLLCLLLGMLLRNFGFSDVPPNAGKAWYERHAKIIGEYNENSERLSP